MKQSTPIRRLLDERGADLTEKVLAQLDANPRSQAERGSASVRQGLGRLNALSRAIESFPLLRECQTLGARHRSLDTLLENFSHADTYTIDAILPTRATLARTYGIAKFNFFRMLDYVICDFLGEEEKSTALAKECRSIGRSAASTLIAEDVLRSICCDDNLNIELRRMSTRILADFWDQRATKNLADFAPLLHSAWRAKASVEISYGTLAGVSETLQMTSAGLDQEFIDSFGDPESSPEQHYAFEEFLFNALYEEIQKMRAFMRENACTALDPASVARIFGVSLERLHRTTNTAEDLFFTFREREQWAILRRLQKLDGPKKTAEEYVMIYVLSRRIS